MRGLGKMLAVGVALMASSVAQASGYARFTTA